jgi:hypothetical protein
LALEHSRKFTRQFYKAIDEGGKIFAVKMFSEAYLNVREEEIWIMRVLYHAWSPYPYGFDIH